MPHKWIRTAESCDNPDSCMYLEASWRREDIKRCVVDIFKYRYQGVMARWKGARKPYSVCVYAENPKDSKHVAFHFLREATQYADTMLRLNSLK